MSNDNRPESLCMPICVGTYTVRQAYPNNPFDSSRVGCVLVDWLPSDMIGEDVVVSVYKYGSAVPNDSAMLARFCSDVNEAIIKAMGEKDERFCVNWGDLNCVDASVSFHMPGNIVDNKPVLTAYIEEGECDLFNKWVHDEVKPKWPNYHIDIKTEW